MYIYFSSFIGFIFMEHSVKQNAKVHDFLELFAFFDIKFKKNEQNYTKRCNFRHL